MASLTTYRRTLAPLLGAFFRGTADATGNTTSRLAVTSLCAFTGLPFQSSINSDQLFIDKWLGRQAAAAAADRDRQIATYTPASGFLDPDDAWTNAPTSEAFEITSMFSQTKLNAFVNEGLKRCWATREFTFTVSHANVRQHNLASGQTWLRDYRWVYQLGHLATGESRIGTSTVAQTDPFSRWKTGKGYNLPGQAWIEGPSWLTTDTVYALAISPAYNLCRVTGGTYGGQNGLTLESDEAPVDEYWVAWAAVLAAADEIGHLVADGQATKEAREARSIAASRFTRLTAEYFQPPRRTFRPLEWLGPTWDDSWY